MNWFDGYFKVPWWVIAISVTLVCLVVFLIAGDPSLADVVAPDCGKMLGEISDYLIDTVIHDIIPASDVDFSEKFGVYMNRKGCSNFGGTQKELNLPHNQYLIMTYGLAETAFRSFFLSFVTQNE